MLDIQALREKALALDELRQIQHQLATAGHHRDAIRLGRKIKIHSKRIAKFYLAINDIPKGPNKFLVSELCIAMAKAGKVDEKNRSRLRLAAWSKDEETTEKLERAYEALPDLEKALEMLK